MIKAAAEKQDGSLLLVFGLSRRNCELILDGKPILINIEKFRHMAAAATAKKIEICIMGGETEEAIAEELKEFVGPETELIISGSPKGQVS